MGKKKKLSAKEVERRASQKKGDVGKLKAQPHIAEKKPKR